MTHLLSLLFLVISLGLLVLVYYSIVVFDVAYPLAHPLMFFCETFLAGAIPTLFLVAIYAFRRQDITNSNLPVFFIFFIKFIIVQLLFQFSGLYKILFRY